MSNVSPTLNAEALYQQLLKQIKPQAVANDNLAIIGIYSGGAWIAERLVNDLGLKNKPGLIDVSFYRDDYAAKGLHADVKPTHIPFEVDGAHIILVTTCCTRDERRAQRSTSCSTTADPPVSCWRRWWIAVGVNCRLLPILLRMLPHLNPLSL
jgi:hypothetical protein